MSTEPPDLEKRNGLFRFVGKMCEQDTVGLFLIFPQV